MTGGHWSVSYTHLYTFIIDALSTAVEFRNGESGQHIRRIRGITEVLLRHLAVTHRELGLGEEQVETIIYAAAMHEIGKIAIPDSVLLKPGKLTEYEYAIMKRHTLYGCCLFYTSRCVSETDVQLRLRGR